MDLDTFIKRRNKCFLTDDVAGLRQLYLEEGQRPLDERAYEIGFHKARYEVVEMPDHLRNASRKWLQDRGYSRLGGKPW